MELPPNKDGHLNVGGALDLGILSVIKDMGLKEPYVGQCQLQTGEIAEDLTYYFATSEQIPSAVGLGVLMNKNNTVRQAGGFIIQLMPFTSDEIIEKLERGLTPEGILEEILGDFGLEITDKIPAAFVCDCSKERVSRALSTLSKKDLDDIINDGESIEVKCQFCNKAYEFSVEERKYPAGSKDCSFSGTLSDRLYLSGSVFAGTSAAGRKGCADEISKRECFTGRHFFRGTSL